jgi:hypothetical protein
MYSILTLRLISIFCSTTVQMQLWTWKYHTHFQYFLSKCVTLTPFNMDDREHSNTMQQKYDQKTNLYIDFEQDRL